MALLIGAGLGEALKQLTDELPKLITKSSAFLCMQTPTLRSFLHVFRS